MPTIALAQIDVHTRDSVANLAQAVDLAGRAREAGADILLLPELWYHGYCLEQAAKRASPLGDGGFARMAQLAREYSLYVCGSTLERHERGVSNTAALYGPNGDCLGSYRKVHLFRLMDEHKYIVPGDRAVLCETPWGLVGLAICYDLRFPELFRVMALAGAELFLVPAQWPLVRLEAWLILARARAVENELFLAACNRTGTDEDDVVFPGRSMIAGPLGEVLAIGDAEQHLTVASVDLNDVEKARRYLPVYEDRRPDAYRLP